MAEIREDYNGQTRLRDWWRMVKDNFKSINTQLEKHIAGTGDRHKAEDITLESDITAAADVKAGIEKNALAIAANTEAIAGKVDAEEGKGLYPTDCPAYTATEQDKLAGIEENANCYVHPATHPAEMIAQDAAHRMVSDTQIAGWDGKLSPVDIVAGDNVLITANGKTLTIAADVGELSTVVLEEQTGSYTAAGGETSIPIGIDGYEPDTDILHAYCDNVPLLEDNYTVTDGQSVALSYPASAGEVYTFHVLKSAGVSQVVRDHLNNRDNPHNVTKKQVGLEHVDDVKQASQEAFDAHLAGHIKAVDSLDSDSKIDALSAAQGKVLNGRIGALNGLKTAAKGSLTEAVNEVFTDVDNGKNAIAAAIIDKGGDADGGDSFAQLAEAIEGLSTGGGQETAIFLTDAVWVAPKTGLYDITCIGRGEDGSYTKSGRAGSRVDARRRYNKGDRVEICVDREKSSFCFTGDGRSDQLVAHRGGYTKADAASGGDENRVATDQHVPGWNNVGGGSGGTYAALCKGGSGYYPGAPGSLVGSKAGGGMFWARGYEAANLDNGSLTGGGGGWGDGEGGVGALGGGDGGKGFASYNRDGVPVLLLYGGGGGAAFGGGGGMAGTDSTGNYNAQPGKGGAGCVVITTL